MGSPFIGVTIDTDIHTQEALVAVKAATVLATDEVFKNQVLVDAKANCPVGTDPIEPGSTRNRDSLDVEVWITKKGPFGKLFSESGHGGFVEVGTVFMTAQPYAWPALQSHIPTLVMQIKTRIAAITVPPVQLGRVMVIEERNI